MHKECTFFARFLSSHHVPQLAFHSIQNLMPLRLRPWTLNSGSEAIDSTWNVCEESLGTSSPGTHAASLTDPSRPYAELDILKFALWESPSTIYSCKSVVIRTLGQWSLLWRQGDFKHAMQSTWRWYTSCLFRYVIEVLKMGASSVQTAPMSCAPACAV